MDPSTVKSLARIAQRYGITHLKVTPDGGMTMVREAVTLPSTFGSPPALARLADSDRLETEDGFTPASLLSDA